MQTNVRTNERIFAKQVRCIDEDGKPIGVMSKYDAIKLARSRGVDLIEIVPNATPPVCKIMEYGKYVYDLKKREKEQRPNVKRLKEVNFHPQIEPGDLTRKISQVVEFLKDGHPVHVSLSFRGRENAHKEFGYSLVERVTQACSDVAVVGQKAGGTESDISVYLTPKKQSA